MESRIRIFLLRALIIALVAGSLQACSFLRVDNDDGYDTRAPVIDPELERRTVTEADIDSEDFEAGFFVGVMSVEDFGSNLVYGVRGAYHITEDFFAEAAYGTTDTSETSFELLSGGAQLLTDDEREYSYYNISLGVNLLPGETFIGDDYAFNSALYLIGGIGSTEFANDSHFTINFGMGYRFLATDWLAIHADVRDHLFKSDLLGDDKVTNNIELTTGVTLFF